MAGLRKISSEGDQLSQNQAIAFLSVTYWDQPLSLAVASKEQIKNRVRTSH